MNEYEIFLGEAEEVQADTTLADSPEQAIDLFLEEHPGLKVSRIWAQNVDDPDDYLIQ